MLRKMRTESVRHHDTQVVYHPLRAVISDHDLFCFSYRISAVVGEMQSIAEVLQLSFLQREPLASVLPDFNCLRQHSHPDQPHIIDSSRFVTTSLITP